MTKRLLLALALAPLAARAQTAAPAPAPAFTESEALRIKILNLEQQHINDENKELGSLQIELQQELNSFAQLVAADHPGFQLQQTKDGLSLAPVAKPPAAAAPAAPTPAPAPVK